MFFIYGQYDQDNVRELDPSYYAAAAEPKAIWEVADASHTGAIDSRPHEYERRVIAFFDRALLGTDTARIDAKTAKESVLSGHQ